MSEADDKIRCDACPVMCFIRPGMTGACDRYANDERASWCGSIAHVLLERARFPQSGGALVPFAGEWDGRIVLGRPSVRDGHRRRHHLSRLQARAVHRLVAESRASTP